MAKETVQLTRAELIALRLKRAPGLKPEQAAQAVDAQIARDAKPIKIKKTEGIRLSEVKDRLDDIESRLETLEGKKPAKA